MRANKQPKHCSVNVSAAELQANRWFPCSRTTATDASAITKTITSGTHIRFTRAIALPPGTVVDVPVLGSWQTLEYFSQFGTPSFG